MFNFKKIILSKSLFTVFLFLLLAVSNQQNTFAQSVDSVLSANVTKLNLEDTVEVNLFVTPHTPNPVFTVSTNLRYDPDMLDFQDAVLPDTWIQLSHNPYKITDTINGLIMRTAGYPTGLYERGKFVKYIFKAKKEGETSLRIFTGKTLNAENNDVGVQSTSLDLRIEEQLDDSQNLKTAFVNLSLNLKGDNAFYKQEDYTFTIYHKKLDKDELAMSKIWVFDENANLHFESERVWSTGNDTVLPFVIPADTIVSEGNYRIIAKVRYANEKEEVVAEKSVGVLSNGQNWFTKHQNIFMPIFIFLIIVSAIHHLFVEREVYRKLHISIRKK